MKPSKKVQNVGYALDHMLKGSDETCYASLEAMGALFSRYCEIMMQTSVYTVMRMECHQPNVAGAIEFFVAYHWLPQSQRFLHVGRFQFAAIDSPHKRRRQMERLCSYSAMLAMFAEK